VLPRIVAAAARRPGRVVALTLVATLVAAAFALRLDVTTGTDVLVGGGSETRQATDRYHARFGDDAVYVLVRQDLTDLVLTEDLGRLLGLEGCISGNAPRDRPPPGGAQGPCGRLAATKPVRAVFGPATFINTSAEQLSGQIARQAREAESAADRAARRARSGGGGEAAARQARAAVQQRFQQRVVALALRYGLTGLPRIDDPAFVSRLVFDESRRPVGAPKQRFAFLFPTRSSALVQVRLDPELSDAERGEAIRLVRAAVAMPEWRLQGGGRYVVTGAPVVANDVVDSVTASIVVLLVAALLVMAATLAVVFRVPLRLLPLAVAVAAAALTFGALSLAGASLTLASVAVVPVLIGLAVDYAIQLQARTREEGSPEAMAVRGAPTVVTAAAATAAGFLVLLLSPVPMVRGFGLLLVAGIVVALALALTFGTAALVAGGRIRGPRDTLLGASVRGAGELLAPAGRVVRRAGRRLPAGRVAAATLAVAQRRPGRVLAVAAVVAVAGWGLDTQTRVESDVTRLVPADASVRDLRALQEATGVGGTVDVLVEGADVTDPRVLRWMDEVQETALREAGYTTAQGCGRADLCPAFSLPDLFPRRPESREQVRATLGLVPPYFASSVLARDRRAATISFGIRLGSLEEQKAIMDRLRDGLEPPAGVRAELVGLSVLAAEANALISSDGRRVLTLVLGLLAVFVVLLVALRTVRRAVVPLVPIALATGWSAAVLFALRVPLNPLSATLGALVIAISTEFSVLLSERYRAEREAGHPPGRALERTYRSTGRAVLASGATAIAGFAVLVLSDIPMLRDFGFVTVVDLTVSLLGVLVVLPAVLVLAEGRADGSRARLRVRPPRLPRRRAVRA
jgi:hypothetical protein